MRLCTFLLASIVGSPLALRASDEAPPEVQIYIDAMDGQRADQAALLRKEGDGKSRRRARAIEQGADYVPTLLLEMKAGSIGALEDPTPPHVVLDAQIRQVIDANSVIVELKYLSSNRLVWVETDTTGMVDDQSFDVESTLFEMKGTKTYETAIGGSRTVPLLRLFDKKPFDEWRKANPIKKTRK